MSWSVERVASTASTMDDARAKARAGAPDRWAIVADEQTAARGTHGRAWAAPKGGLYASFILRSVPSPHLVTLALGNAVADVLEVAGVEPRLKWVNDVLVGDRKVAGILVEGESTGPRLDFLVCGIGINVNGTTDALPRDLRARATTLESELGCDSCLPDLETFLWQAIDKWLATLAQAPGEVVAAFRARDALKDRPVRVDSGAESFEGIASGIDDAGHLVLASGSRTRSFAAGTVTLLDA